MDNDSIFQKIEDTGKNSDEKINDIGNDQNIQDAFVTGLPDWDLEPPFDTIKRSVSK